MNKFNAEFEAQVASVFSNASFEINETFDSAKDYINNLCWEGTAGNEGKNAIKKLDTEMVRIYTCNLDVHSNFLNDVANSHNTTEKVNIDLSKSFMP